MYSVFAAGGCVHLMRVQDALAPNIIAYIEEHRISLFSNVPMIFKAFADLAKHLNTDGLNSLRMAMCGSAPLSDEVARLFYREYGKHLHQAYGLSEIGPICVNLFENDHYDYNSVGRIFPEIEYRLLDEAGEDLIIPAEGHLLLRGKSMTKGYLCYLTRPLEGHCS